MRNCIRAALLAAMVSAGPAMAQDSEYGSAVDFTKRNCAADPAVACGTSVAQRSRVGGAFNEIDAGFAATGTGVGSTAAALVEFGAFGLPTIRARANALGNVRIGAFIVSYQVYEYTGATDLDDLRLSANYHIVNSSTDSGNGGGTGGAIAGAGFAIWDEDDFFTYSDAYFTGTGNFSNPASMTGQGYLFGTTSCATFSAYAGSEDLPVGPRASNTFPTQVLTGGEASFAVEQQNCREDKLTFHSGDEFVIASYVQLVATRNGFVDATGTFTLGLDASMSEADTRAFRENTTFGNGSSGAVPEPATWAMMIAGFGAIGGVLRRRRGAMASAIGV